MRKMAIMSVIGMFVIALALFASTVQATTNINNDPQFVDSSKWALSYWDQGTPAIHDQNFMNYRIYTYYDSRANGYNVWGNTEYTQNYKIWNNTVLGSQWSMVFVPLTTANQQIQYNAKLGSVGGSPLGQGNAYIDI